MLLGNITFKILYTILGKKRWMRKGMNNKNSIMRVLFCAIVVIFVCIVIFKMVDKFKFNENDDSATSNNQYWEGDFKIEVNDELQTVGIYGYQGDGNLVVPAKIESYKVNYIDDFIDNEDIVSVYIPLELDQKVRIILDNCSSLRKIEYAVGTKIINTEVFDCNSLKELVIPEGVEEISGCFLRCKALENITFPSSLRAASGYDFKGTTFSELHKNDKYYVIGDGVLLFFNGDSNLDIVIPEGVKCFDDYISKEEVTPRNIYIPDTISVLRIQLDDGDTLFMGEGEIERLDLNCLSKGIKGTIVAPANSYIEQYCKEKGYRFRVMTDEEEKKWREKTEAAASEITYQE
jgi:hypothetical protein